MSEKITEYGAGADADRKLYLDDLEIGMTFTGGTRLISEDAIIAFAHDYDPQPFHLDAEAAKATIFEGLAASGWHTAAVTMRLLVDCLGNLSGGLVGAGAELNWPAPTRPGDVLRVKARIAEITLSKSRPGRGIVSLQADTINQKDVVVQKLAAKLVVFKRPETAGL